MALLSVVWVLTGTPVCHAQTIRSGWGPFDVNLDLGAKFEVEWTDNVDSSEDNKKDDTTITLGPYVGGTVGMDLPIAFSGGQRMSISTSLSYDAEYSLSDGEWDENWGSPITVSAVLPFIVYGWDLTFYDTFTFSNEPLESTVSYEEEDEEEYDNTAGFTLGKRFGRYGITFDGNRKDSWAPDSPTLEETSYTFSVVPSFYLRNGISFFVNGTVGYVLPDDPSERDVINNIITAGVAGPITQNISGSISAGWSWSHLQGKTYVDRDTNLPITLPDETIDGPTVNLSLSYAEALRPNTTHSLSVFHNPGITAVLEDSEVSETTGATYTISHRLNRYLVLSPTVGWVFLRDVTPGPTASGEETHIINVGMALSRSFGKHLSSTLRYQYQTRDSNLEGESYDENKITFTVLYIF